MLDYTVHWEETELYSAVTKPHSIIFEDDGKAKEDNIIIRKLKNQNTKTLYKSNTNQPQLFEPSHFIQFSILTISSPVGAFNCDVSIPPSILTGYP